MSNADSGNGQAGSEPPVTIPVLADDPGRGMTIVGFSQAEHGTVVLNPDVTFTYTPSAGFEGEDSFTYLIRQGGNGPKSVAKVSVTVIRPGTDADVRDDETPVSMGEGVVVPTLTGGDNPDGDPLTMIEITAPAHDTANVEIVENSHAPDTDLLGFESFSYTVGTDGEGASTAKVIVDVTVVDTPPSAEDDIATTPEGTPVTIDLLATERMTSGDGPSLLGVTIPVHGTLAVNPDQTVIYTPEPGFVGADGFSYMAGDGRGGRASASVVIEVTPAK